MNPQARARGQVDGFRVVVCEVGENGQLYGLAWAGLSDDPLTPPWRGASRFGAFFGWGELKVAWLGGSDRRVLVTQQFQLIPWVF